MYPEEPANTILREAATHLRELVEIAAKRVGVEDLPQISQRLRLPAHPTMRDLIGIQFEEPRHSPEWGAVIWARQHSTG